MLISYSHQFIFFHVAKTGGLSMRDALKPYSRDPDKFRVKRPKPEIDGKPNRFYEVWEASLLHASAQQARQELPEDVFYPFFKFAFVRNPWDLQVSMYHFVLREPEHIYHDQIKALSGFEEYAEWVAAAAKPYPKGAPKLQRDMLVNQDGALLVDFVGRFERLSEDFTTICQRLKLAICLPHRNKTEHRGYQSYYSPRSRQLIADAFAADIEQFHYTFE